MRITVRAELDETGRLEEFTGDLSPLVSSRRTLHLDESGLPKPGVMIQPGMIVVGKIGRTRSFDPGQQANCTGIRGYRVKVRKKYGHMWRDASLYADQQMAGRVTRACLIEDEAIPTAVVEIVPEMQTGRADAGVGRRMKTKLLPLIWYAVGYAACFGSVVFVHGVLKLPLLLSVVIGWLAGLSVGLTAGHVALLRWPELRFSTAAHIDGLGHLHQPMDFVVALTICSVLAGLAGLLVMFH